MLNNKKAAKKLLKRAKAHPDWYSEEDVKYAKMIKKKLKNVKQSVTESKVNQKVNIETRYCCVVDNFYNR